MIDFKITKDDIDKFYNKKKPTSTKLALSKQATVENAMNNRQPQNPNAPMPQTGTADGFGRTLS